MSGGEDGAAGRDEALAARRADRHRFLRRLYELSDADVSSFHDGREIADELGIPMVEAERIIRYFEERGYLRHVAGGGLTLRITVDGIDQVETGLR